LPSWADKYWAHESKHVKRKPGPIYIWLKIKRKENKKITL